MPVLHGFQKHTKLKVAVFVVLGLVVINIFLKLALGVYFPWHREDWSFLPYTYWNEDSELKGGAILSYEGQNRVVVVPSHISTPFAVDGMDSTRVVSIEQRAFGYLSPSQAEAIEIIIVSEGIEKIEKMAFFDCENLKLLYLPMSIKEISENAFVHISDATIITFNPIVREALELYRNK